MFYLKRLFFIIILIFCISSCTIKKPITKNSEEKDALKEINYIPYYSEIYKADSLYITHNYKETYKILNNLLKNFKPVDGWFVNVSRNYLISKSKVSKITRNDVEKYLNEKAYDASVIFNDKNIVELLNEFNITRNEVEKITKENVSKINMPLRLEISKMNYDDQQVRQTIKNNDSIKKVDWQHSERLKEIIKTYGFPNKKLVGDYKIQGKYANIGLSVIFNHISYNGDYEYFKKKLPELIKNGTCDPFNYGMMVDRKNEINNKPIEYYLIIAIDEKVDKKKINANRKAIGLPTVEYQEFKKKVMSN